ncbi:MAG: hypothetical protein OEW08_10870 [Gammaproteobacteria bacterium]|nr:hypothetical protein [Gammaproteobacteria bacterium]
MSAKTWAIAAIVLWVLGAGVLVTKFMRGSTTAGTDGRTAVLLAASERDAVLGEMRALLAGVQGIIDGLARGDMKRVADAASHVGMSAAVDTNPAILMKLPLAFKQTGMGVHRTFDDIAAAATKGESKEQLQTRLAAQLAVCVGCHETYQLKDEATK